jgi:hypothetical protein
LTQHVAQSIQEVIPVSIIPKYLSAFDPPYHNVVQCTRGIQTSLTRHIPILSFTPSKATNNPMDVPIFTIVYEG